MTRFEFEDSDAFAEEEAAYTAPGGPEAGIGEAVDGQVRAVVSAEGRLTTVDISPDLLRHGRGGGTYLDSTALGAAITAAVNAAFDDLVRKTAAAPDTSGLADVGASFERSINEVRAELERAERRLEGR